MSNEERKRQRQAAAAEAKRKHQRAMDRLDGKEAAAPEFGATDPAPDVEDDGAPISDTGDTAEPDGGFDHAPIPPGGADEAFAAARRALLEVSAPKDRSAKAQQAEAAARLMRGFTWEAGPLGLPPFPPIRPVGKNKGHLYFMDTNDEFVDLSASKLGQQGEIDNLFGPAIGWLWSFYGKTSSNGELRIKYEDVRRDLIGACGRLVSRQGLFDPMRKVRGRGAWKTDAGVLILHLGSELWVGGQKHELGEFGGHVYARDVDLVPPADEDEPFSDELADLFYEAGLLGEDDDRAKAPGRWLLKSFRTWKWMRPDLDPYFVLGYIVCVMMGAALKWRPAIYPTGDKATGKSSLLDLVKKTLGDRLMDLADATGPGIYQSLGLAAIGVWCDEFEQEGEQAADTRAAAVMRLARYASDGKNVVRGGQDGVPTNYQARGTFGFTGINPPPMKPAELSRMAMPMLGPFPKPKKGEEAAKAPELSEALGEELGRHLLRRVVDRWHEWDDVLTAWRGVLMSHGHDSRAADTFGTLLAAAHMALHDGVPLQAVIEPMAKSLPRAAMAETASDKGNWEKCIDRLLQAQPDAWRSYKYRSVGEYLTAVLDDRPKDDPDETTPMNARDRLATAGLGVCMPRSGPLAHKLCLVIPNDHAQVGRLFEGSPWSMGNGAVHGGWVFALKPAVALEIGAESKQRIDGRNYHCTILDLARIIAPAGEGEAITERPPLSS